MRRLLLLPALLLASCAPIITKGAQSVQGTLATYTATGGQFVFKNLDSLPALGVVLVLDGISTSDGRCKTTPDQLTACRLGNVNNLDSTSPVAYTGKIVSGSLTWRDPGGRVLGLPVAAE